MRAAHSFRLSHDDVTALRAGQAVIRDDALGRPVASAVAASVHAIRELEPAGVGPKRQVDRTLRGDAVAWLADVADDSLLLGLHGWFEDVMRELNRACGLDLDDYTVQVSRYPGDGTGYVWHLDAEPGDVDRVVTAILFLNPEWVPDHGGVLRVSELGVGERDLEPVLDRLVLFASDRVEHEVRPVHHPRWAVTAWYRRAHAASGTIVGGRVPARPPSE